MSITIFIADDQVLLASALATILSSQADLEVVATGSTGQSAVDYAARVDVIILDVRMPGMDGVVALRRIKSLDNLPKMIMLTTFNSPSAVEEAIIAGADGFLLKDADPEYLISAVRSVARGESVLSAGVTSQVLESWRHSLTAAGPPLPAHVQQGLSLLTPRESSVLQLVARGLSNQEIADELYISQTTVQSHISSLLSKLNARDRIALIILAREAGVDKRG